MTAKIYRLSVLAGSFLLAANSAGHAESMTFAAHLLGSAAVPQNKSDAFGEAQLTYNSDTRHLDYYVTYDGLSPTKIDFHGPAGSAENAATILSIPVSETPISGTVTLTKDQANILLAGKTYLDMHSKTYGDGEIRGQVHKQ